MDSKITPAEYSLRSRMGVNKSWAQTEDWPARTAPARKAFFDRFLDKVDPDGRLPIEERTKRARKAMEAHMQSLSAKAAEGRRLKKAAKQSRPSSDAA